jgi:hypothetical protein
MGYCPICAVPCTGHERHWYRVIAFDASMLYDGSNLDDAVRAYRASDMLNVFPIGAYGSPGGNPDDLWGDAACHKQTRYANGEAADAWRCEHNQPGNASGQARRE